MRVFKGYSINITAPPGRIWKKLAASFGGEPIYKRSKHRFELPANPAHSVESAPEGSAPLKRARLRAAPVDKRGDRECQLLYNVFQSRDVAQG